MALWGWAAMKAQRVRNSRFQSPKGLRRGTVAAADEDPAAAEAAAPEAAPPAADPPALVPAAVRRERSTSTGIGITRRERVERARAWRALVREPLLLVVHGLALAQAHVELGRRRPPPAPPPRADVDGPRPPEAAESAEAAAAASSPAFLSWLARMPMPSAAIMRWFPRDLLIPLELVLAEVFLRASEERVRARRASVSGVRRSSRATSRRASGRGAARGKKRNGLFLNADSRARKRVARGARARARPRVFAHPPGPRPRATCLRAGRRSRARGV